jgi:hypothetical protein
MTWSKSNFLILAYLGFGIASLTSLALERHPVATVTGAVVAAESGAPLSGAIVSWSSGKVLTDSAGRYRIEMPPAITEISVTAPGCRAVRKVLFVRDASAPLTQDVLLPASGAPAPKVLALDRGSRLSPRGKDLSSDAPGDSTISLADEYGNDDRLLRLGAGRARVHSPVWFDASTIAFGKEGLLHDPETLKSLGVFRYDTGTGTVSQVVSKIGAQFLGLSPGGDALAIAGQKEIYVLPSLSGSAQPRRIFTLDRQSGFLLSIAWGSDDRLYFTVDDSIPLDNRHFQSRSRIASIKPDGTDLRPDWAAAAQFSFRYPTVVEGGDLVFCRFALNGAEQTLLRRRIAGGETTEVAGNALRAVHIDASRLYYIYWNELHLRDRKSGADWVILNSVKEAAYLRGR